MLFKSALQKVRRSEDAIGYCENMLQFLSR